MLTPIVTMATQSMFGELHQKLKAKELEKLHLKPQANQGE